MKLAKKVLMFCFLSYCLMFAMDYIAARRSATKENCARIMSMDKWFIFVFAGYPNACIDKGLWP
jgi:hypothetical protein